MLKLGDSVQLCHGRKLGLFGNTATVTKMGRWPLRHGYVQVCCDLNLPYLTTFWVPEAALEPYVSPEEKRQAERMVDQESF